jgi:hypothetical protein
VGGIIRKEQDSPSVRAKTVNKANSVGEYSSTKIDGSVHIENIQFFAIQHRADGRIVLIITQHGDSSREKTGFYPEFIKIIIACCCIFFKMMLY